METEQEFIPGELTPEDAKASLGLATRLGEEFLISQNPPAEVTGVEEDVSQETPAPEVPQDNSRIDEVEARIMEELSSLKKMIEKSQGGDDEIEQLKAEIDAVLNSDE